LAKTDGKQRPIKFVPLLRKTGLMAFIAVYRVAEYAGLLIILLIAVKVHKETSVTNFPFA
jgi:hypothetical protein